MVSHAQPQRYERAGRNTGISLRSKCRRSLAFRVSGPNSLMKNVGDNRIPRRGREPELCPGFAVINHER